MRTPKLLDQRQTPPRRVWCRPGILPSYPSKACAPFEDDVWLTVCRFKKGSPKFMSAGTFLLAIEAYMQFSQANTLGLQNRPAEREFDLCAWRFGVVPRVFGR